MTLPHKRFRQADTHGPLLAALQVATNDGMWSKMQSIIAQLHARSAQLIVMCNGGDSPSAQLRRLKCRMIEVRCSECTTIHRTLFCRFVSILQKLRAAVRQCCTGKM